ncbi:uncharacterized protein Z519_00906 [Cladophialophora bantiana CBS 173.52]|uniref:Zn(2)-C6 fungal-type domain-containing protein n=1 Tax=Cladophialophora bantiana (strain ATCC 10958 / CBS 173.52 / CDC B-1940 / NIH 8579) TaxID=1442370 RepID=A0A0D2I0J4_CLAB1|nr:uncharacterized protein Z519_00906 [Cladophialophora bantiana CBS 173.52]KIW99243.1 hypothetical protein Z519_00906 [Cladophialophora bantiana CBS 173.52]
MTPRTADPQSRASAACTACRIRRTKCIVDSGQSSCDYCQSKGMECTFQALDDRKRPKSKVYLNSLLENIQILEQRLREAGHEPPQFQQSVAQSQPTQRHQRNFSPRDKESSRNIRSTADRPRFQPVTCPDVELHTSLEQDGVHSSPASVDAVLESIQRSSDVLRPDSAGLDSINSHNSVRQRSASEPHQLTNRKSTIWSLIYGPDRFIYDREKGRIHYFSPSTCYKRYLNSDDHATLKPSHLDKHSYRILAEIPVDLESYIMDLFWNRYNNTLCVIDRQAFQNDQSSGGSTYYSVFLHLVCLAMGFRFADESRPGMQQVMLNDSSSVFQREAKFLLDRELEDPRGLTIIQAMLVLSDLECASGRDDVAGMHIATSCRLAFDFGLNLDCSRFGLSSEETKFRKDLLRSCLIYDQAWALYVERPTNMKISDISRSCLTNRVSCLNDSGLFQRKPTDESTGLNGDLHGHILDSLLELSELSSKIQALAQPRLTFGSIADEDRLIDVAALDAKLKSCQQFHVAQLNLHGPYGRYEDALGVEMEKAHVFRTGASDSGNGGALQHLARSVTMNAAMKIAQGFSAYRQRFGTCETGVFSLQQGGTALLALMSTIKVSKETGKRNSGLHHLYMLMEQLREMSRIYNPADLMCRVVKHEMERLEIDFSDLPTPPNTPIYPVSPSTAASAQQPNAEHHSDSGPATKRRRFSTDPDCVTVTCASLPDSAFNQNPAFSAMRSSPQHGVTEVEAPAQPPASLPQAQPSETVPAADTFEPLDPMPDPILDLNSIQPSSWSLGLSDISALFDFQSHDQIGNDMLLPFVPETHYLPGGTDPTLRMLPDVMQYG